MVAGWVTTARSPRDPHTSKKTLDDGKVISMSKDLGGGWMKSLNTLALSLALVIPALAHAQSDSWPAFSAERAGSAQYRACMARGSTSINEANCLSEELQRQQTELSIAFANNVEGVTPAVRAQHIKAQNAWEAYRDANCAVRSMNGGSGSGIFLVSCLIRETITRRTELTDNWDY